jgi:hypothetical protein
MSAQTLFLIELALLNTLAVSFLLYLAWKRFNSTEAQVLRLFSKVINFYWKEKSFILEVYKVGLSLFFANIAQIKGSETSKKVEEIVNNAATSGNSKADQVISAIKSLTLAVKEATKKEEKEVIPFSQQVKNDLENLNK